LAEERAEETERGYEIMPPDAVFEDGFNLKTVWGALFVGFVMMPGVIYLGLVTGQSMVGAAEWVTIILFIEITKRYFVRLKTQEIIILYWAAAGLVVMGGKLGSAVNLFGGPFGNFIWDQFLVQSPQATGVSNYIPDWLVPPRGSEALLGRSFMHSAWLKPILVLVIVMAFRRVSELSLGYTLFRVACDIERLPFPMAEVRARGATALAETSAKQEGWRWRMFSIGTFIGMIYGLLYVVLPTVSGIFLTKTVVILPIPFIDLTVNVKNILPSSPLGVETNLLVVLTGFVLPFWVVVGTFAASMTATFGLNPLLWHNGILKSWSAGMSTIPTRICNDIDFYLSFGIGSTFVVFFLGITIVIRTLLRRSAQRRAAGAGEAGKSEELPPGRSDISIWKALLIWAGATAGLVIMVYVLVPEFPWWITAGFGFVWVPIYSYISARMIGYTGSTQHVGFPYLREGSFYVFGQAAGAKIWFAPVPMENHGGMAQTFRQLEMTRTKFISLVKLKILAFVLMLICSFVYWSFIWKLAPIPSGAYPYVQKMWPFHATMQTLWVKSTIPAETLLMDFEDPDEVVWSPAERGRGSLYYATRESHSLEVDLQALGQESQISLIQAPQDWREFRGFKIDIYNPKEEAVKVVLRFRDLEGGMVSTETVIPSQERNFMVEVPFSEGVLADERGAVDLSSLETVDIIVPQAERGEKIYLDNLRLYTVPRSYIEKIIRWKYILSGFISGWVIYGLFALFGIPTLTFYGYVNGLRMWPHHAIPLFIGAIVGRYYFRRKLGHQKWRAYAPIILAGYGCGMGLIGMTSIALALIAKAISNVVL